ncbi:MAG: hypothetical protein K6E91_10465 [Butyrivibrio sp.]|nr:hypothetical protein [Butyrivibrio sp.]
MDFGFLASANNIKNTYLNQTSQGSVKESVLLDEETKKKFGKEFEAAYDSMVATKMLNESMRQSYASAHEDSISEHASRLGYSIDNRVIDMLHQEISDDMNSKVNAAMGYAIDNMMSK